ncbi:MAG TPA: FtsX-like permease family protein [Propionibacteriaceae bacterium]
MWHLSLKELLSHRFRLALTTVAVVLGVTFVTGSLVLTDTSQRLFDDQFATATAGVDLTVRDAVAFGSAMGVEVERDPLPPSMTARIAAVPGVGDVRPVVQGSGLIQVEGRTVVPKGPSMLSSWSPPPFGAFELRAGRAPDGSDEVVVDAATAEQQGIALDEFVTVRAEETERLRVVGIAGFGDRAGLPNATVALVSLPTGQRLLDLGNGVTEVSVLVDDTAATSQVQADLSRALGASYEVSTSQDSAAASAAAAKASLSYLRLMLFALAGAALLVGGFLIANTFAIVISQRTRELAVLRAAGATGRQIFGAVLAEALVVGLVGSAVGVGLGVVGALGLRGLVSSFGIALPDGDVTVLPRSLALAFGLGVVVTVLAAAGPARQASRVSPVEAMRQAVAVTAASPRRLVAGLAATAAGSVVVVLVAVAPVPVLLAAPGAVLTVAGLTLLGPALAPRLASVVGRPLDAAGVTGRLARQSAARAPRRTAATAMALALSLALITFITVVASSAKGSIRDAYTEVITADFVIESARAEMLGGLPELVHHHVSELPEVAVASRLRFGHWKDGAVTSALTAVDPETLPQVTSLDLVQGTLSHLEQGGVIVAQHVAVERGLSVGDRLPMTFSRTGEKRLTIVGLVADDDAQALSTDYLVSLDTFARHFSEKMDASVLVRVAAGVDAGRAQAALHEALTDVPTAEVRDQAAAVDGRTATIDQILGLVSVLLLFAVLIAGLGITNTLALSILERTRELGLLRAVGMTGRQLRWMVRGEALLVAALAVVLGVGLGLGFGAAVVSALGRDASAELVVPLGRLLLIAAVAVAAGLLAGLLPARRAGRLDVLSAIST